MDTNTMKNMIVLKNLPSNMVDTAFIVFKDNVKVHKIQGIDKNKTLEKKDDTKSKEYMVKEAEIIIEDYISKLEKKEYELGSGNKKLNKKYKRLKALTIFLAIFSALSLFLILFR